MYCTRVVLQINPAVSKLALYDVANTAGVAADVSHINSQAQVQVRPEDGAKQWWCKRNCSFVQRIAENYPYYVVRE